MHTSFNLQCSSAATGKNRRHTHHTIINDDMSHIEGSQKRSDRVHLMNHDNKAARGRCYNTGMLNVSPLCTRKPTKCVLHHRCRP